MLYLFKTDLSFGSFTTQVLYFLLPFLKQRSKQTAKMECLNNLKLIKFLLLTLHLRYFYTGTGTLVESSFFY